MRQKKIEGRLRLIEPIGAFFSAVSYPLRLTSSARIFRRPSTRAYPLFSSVRYGVTQCKRALVPVTATNLPECSQPIDETEMQC